MRWGCPVLHENVALRNTGTHRRSGCPDDTSASSLSASFLADNVIPRGLGSDTAVGGQVGHPAKQRFKKRGLVHSRDGCTKNGEQAIIATKYCLLL